MTAFAVSSSFSRAVPTRLSRFPGRSAGSPSAGVAHRAFSACTLCALPKVWWRCPCGGWSGERSVHVSASAAVPPQGVSVRTPARGYRAGSSHRHESHGVTLRRGYTHHAASTTRMRAHAVETEAGGEEMEDDGADSTADEGIAAGDSKGKRVKKRVAMFCGYVGSKFRGLQINRTAAGESTFPLHTRDRRTPAYVFCFCYLLGMGWVNSIAAGFS